MTVSDQLSDLISDRDTFSWRDANPGWIELVSGRWKNGLWSHDVVVQAPAGHSRGDVAVLYITGGEPNEVDLDESLVIAERSGVPVATLFQIPNQPLFDMIEDDLVAHTFEKYIDTGDAEWPLLLPMARAAIRAMDALEKRGLKRFIVTGASKRGWTTWLAAATGDPRIIGIAPMVFDHLNMPVQMAHQLSTWGSFSEQIADYTDRQLQNEVDTERGAMLVRMVDPISYIERIQCPILIINGANDRYWTVDALSNYWDRLPDPKRCLIVPNAGHLLGDKVQMIETLSAFASACARGGELPQVAATVQANRVLIEAPAAVSATVWAAISATLDFRDSEWHTVGNGFEHTFELPDVNVAAMVEARFGGRTGEFSLSTPVQVFRAEKLARS